MIQNGLSSPRAKQAIIPLHSNIEEPVPGGMQWHAGGLDEYL